MQRLLVLMPLAALLGGCAWFHQPMPPARAVAPAPARPAGLSDADGTPIRMVGVTLDITARRQLQERTRLLARAGEALGSSLDIQHTVDQVVRLLVPEFGDWCLVDLLDGTDRLVRMALHHHDPGKRWLSEALYTRYPSRREFSEGPWGVIRSGRL